MERHNLEGEAGAITLDSRSKNEPVSDTRRQFLKRAGVVAWTVPTLQVVNMAAAAAGQTAGSVVVTAPSTTATTTSTTTTTTTTPPCQPVTIKIDQSCDAAEFGCSISGLANLDGAQVRWAFVVRRAADCNGLVLEVSALHSGGPGLYPFRATGSFTDAQGATTPFEFGGTGAASMCAEVEEPAVLHADEITIEPICL